jgi:hypothetical protein
MVHKRKPNYSPLRVFGCCAWAHIQRKERKSLQDHAKPCIFLGCPEDFKGWKLWDPSANGGRGGIIISRNVVWNEEEFPSLSRVAHDAIPKRFGRSAEPGDAERSPDEEDSDSTDSEGVVILPPCGPAVPPSDSDSSSSSSSLSSTTSPSPSPPRTPPRPAPPPGLPCTPPQDAAPGPPSAPKLATRIAPRPAPPKRPLPTPAARAPAPAPAPAPAVDEPETVGLRRSARSNAGVAPPKSWYNATAQLQGKVRGVPVAPYRETATRSSSRGRARAPARSRKPFAGPANRACPIPNNEEEEEAAPEAPREPPVDEDDEDDLYAQPRRVWHADRHWMELLSCPPTSAHPVTKSLGPTSRTQLASSAASCPSRALRTERQRRTSSATSAAPSTTA